MERSSRRDFLGRIATGGMALGTVGVVACSDRGIALKIVERLQISSEDDESTGDGHEYVNVELDDLLNGKREGGWVRTQGFVKYVPEEDVVNRHTGVRDVSYAPRLYKSPDCSGKSVLLEQVLPYSIMKIPPRYEHDSQRCVVKGFFGEDRYNGPEISLRFFRELPLESSQSE